MVAATRGDAVRKALQFPDAFCEADARGRKRVANIEGDIRVVDASEPDDV